MDNLTNGQTEKLKRKKNGKKEKWTHKQTCQLKMENFKF